MSACLAEGTTRISNAAREPEVRDLAALLCSMGARVQGAGTSELVVEGVPLLHSARMPVVPDRIEAGTLLVAGAITGGEVAVGPVLMGDLDPLVEVLGRMGCEPTWEPVGREQHGRGTLRVGRRRPLEGIPFLRTGPFPGFPTDMQPQASRAAARALSQLPESSPRPFPEVAAGDGPSDPEPGAVPCGGAGLREQDVSRIRAGQDGGRHRGVAGGTAGTSPRPNKASDRSAMRSWALTGRANPVHASRLRGEPVEGSDLRAGACLVLAGLAAEGRTVVHGVEHIDRGYDALDAKLRMLGSDIQRL